jgi:hypothetical protein
MKPFALLSILSSHAAMRNAFAGFSKLRSMKIKFLMPFIFLPFLALGQGTVTSVDVVVPSPSNLVIISTGGPVETSGEITLELVTGSGREFLATPANGDPGVPQLRQITGDDVPEATPTQKGIVNISTQSFGGNKTFNDNVNIVGTNGNIFTLQNEAFIYKYVGTYPTGTQFFGFNNSSPTRFFDLKAPVAAGTYYVHRNAAGSESLILDLMSDNITFGLRNAAEETIVKLRSVGLSFVNSNFVVGENSAMEDHPQFKVLGSQNYAVNKILPFNYQMTVQNKTNTNGESAAIGFGVDDNQKRLGAYISFVRANTQSRGNLHFGVSDNNTPSVLEDVLVLKTGGHVELPKLTASALTVTDGDKNLVSGTIGAGLNLTSNILSVDITSLPSESNINRQTDIVAVYDVSAGALVKTTTDNLNPGMGLPFLFGQFNPGDETAYYGGLHPQSSGTTPDVCRIYIYKTGVITAAMVLFDNAGALATAETSTIYIRVNNTTNYTISDVVKNDARPTVYNNNTLNIAVNAGDYIEIYWRTPNWATNPTQVRLSGMVYLQ